MSDTESFVILGTSPTSSLDAISLLQADPIAIQNESIKTNGITDSQRTNISSLTTFSVVQTNDLPDTNGKKEFILSTESNGMETSSSNTILQSNIGGNTRGPEPKLSNSLYLSGGSNCSTDGSLAASFILGEIGPDVLKDSVYTQFPSISKVGSAEEVIKLQNVLTENQQLRNTLSRMNDTMKQLFDQTKTFKAEVQVNEEQRRNEIAKLRNENLMLREDLENKVKHITLNEEARNKDHEDLVKSLSEKSAQIQVMSVQIEKLEQQQLTSFEYIPRNQEGTTQLGDAKEYVTTLQHNEAIKNIQTEMSKLVTENLALKVLQEQYIDEINVHKCNMVAADELLKKHKADIDFLKASDTEKSEIFTQFKNERKTFMEDIDVLRQQLDIYSRDFKIEQTARETLANEKDQLLTDLRQLQRKNQELLQEAQKNYEEHTRQAMSNTGAFPKARPQTPESSSPQPSNPIYTPANFNCPLCGLTFKTFSVLQNHVQLCLDKK